MSVIHDLLQNKTLRIQLIMAASVMEFPSTTQTKWAVWKHIAPKLANYYYFHKFMSLYIPVANVFQCFSIQMLFWGSCYRLDKKICICPSLTQAVSITDAKSLRHNTRHFQCLKLSLEASFINLMGYKNIGKKLVHEKKSFTFEKWCWNHPLFDPFFWQICLKNTK